MFWPFARKQTNVPRRREKNKLSANGAIGGYDALEPKGRRKQSPNVVVREDVHLKGGKRRKLQANANDIARNFSIAAWMVRRHLDYVSRFDFHSRTKDRGLNKEIEAMMVEQSLPLNCDRGGRASREKMFRLAEARRVLDGDTGLLLLRDRRVQGLEADLIRNPEKQLGPHEWIEGVQADSAGLALQYCIWARSRGGGPGYEFKRIVPAENFIQYGFFQRYASEQRRGVSPIVAALNPFRDVYEAFEYSLIKAKIQQLFALALVRDPDAQALDQALPGTSADDEEEEVDSAEVKERTIDLTNGPTVLDLDPGEKVELIESKTPSHELREFTQLVIAVGLKALDIPYSFFDESFTNYSGQRGSWMHYERSCLDARDDQIAARRRWTDFQYQSWILNGQLKLPRSIDRSDLKYEWVPLGMPWWKPVEEITGDLMAIASGLASPQRICKERGTGDIEDNIDDLLEVLKYARDRGTEELGEPLRLNFDPGPFAAAILTANQANQGASNDSGSKK
jgi:capsid protein